MFFIVECSLGYYGYNCNQSCDGCLSDSCDKENGACTDTAGHWSNPVQQVGLEKVRHHHYLVKKTLFNLFWPLYLWSSI
jgi:hypothetical protein